MEAVSSPVATPSVPAGELYTRALIEVKVRSTDAPEDAVVHTIYHHWMSLAGPIADFDWTGHANNVRDVFLHGTGVGATHWAMYTGRMITVRVYDMNDMKPREVKATSLWTPAPWSTTALGPREVAVALRYFGPRNIKGHRGRMYIGPLDQTFIAELVTYPTFAQQILDLGTALGDIGGVNTSWVGHSPQRDTLDRPTSPGGTDPAGYYDIVECWVNDQYQHMETRERAEINRWNVSITPGIP